MNFALMITVKGTGINVYTVVQLEYNISITLDGGSPLFQFRPLNGSCFNIYNQTVPPCYNVSIYNVQSLTYAAHTLNIAMYSGTISFYNATWSDFRFDYAVITSPSSQGSQCVSHFTYGGKILMVSSKSLTSIIGGTIGGIAVTIFIILAVLYYRKRGLWRLPHPMEIDPEPVPTNHIHPKRISPATCPARPVAGNTPVCTSRCHHTSISGSQCSQAHGHKFPWVEW
jgi:hypothetical protein